MAALNAAAGRPAAGGAAREPSDKITLGTAPQEAHERQPEWFAPKDVASFERHEEAFKRLSLLESTIDEVVGDDERNDEAAQQRRLAAAADGASGRRTPEGPTDDEARK